jgi:Cyclic nucleotide-binding domain
MRIERTVTTISWIPSDALRGMLGATEKLRVAHHDEPPPDTVGKPAAETLAQLGAADRFRFSNELTAWIEVEDGRIVDCGYSGREWMGSTSLHLGVGDITVPAVPYDVLQAEPEIVDGSAQFRQTAGGRTGLPIPRAIRRPPFVQYRAPTVWTTLELTIHPDGSHEGRLAGASAFPRHWMYDDDGGLVAKSGLTDLKNWLSGSFGKRTPWGDEDSPALVTAVETALERELSTVIMHGGPKPDVRRLKEGAVLTEQGTPGDELFLLLDGVIAVEVDGAPVAEVGPGAVLGERAVLEGGTRTSTLRCVTPCRTAAVKADHLDRDRLAQLAAGHRREDDLAGAG